MTDAIHALTFQWVNAYLLKGDAGFVLIDTGLVSDRKHLEQALREAGCLPGDLRLIIITHGDPDHSANAAHLRQAYGTKIAMHRAEAPAVEQGDMFLSRSSMPLLRRMLRPIVRLFRLRKRDRFTPDVFLEDGDRLAEYGLDAMVYHVPGHSMGSIAVLTAEGDFFSGDFLENRKRPSVATFVDDARVLTASFDRVKDIGIRTVHPGHGGSFGFTELS